MGYFPPSCSTALIQPSPSITGFFTLSLYSFSISHLLSSPCRRRSCSISLNTVLNFVTAFSRFSMHASPVTGDDDGDAGNDSVLPPYIRRHFHKYIHLVYPYACKSNEV